MHTAIFKKHFKTVWPHCKAVYGGNLCVDFWNLKAKYDFHIDIGCNPV